MPEILNPEQIKSIIESNDEIKFILDTNIILAYLNHRDQFHLEASTAIDGLKVKNVYFIIPHIIIGEFIAHRDRIGAKNLSITGAIKKLDKFLLNTKKFLSGGQAVNASSITNYYLKHKKHKNFTKLGFSDFLILCLAEEVNNIRILTCDKKMYKYGRSVFKKRIYYLPNTSSGMKSDYPRLMADIQRSFK